MKIRAFLLAWMAVAALAVGARAGSEGLGSPGRLDAIGAEGKALGACPLRHTDVQVEVAGFVARVTVRQQFHNPFAEKIEAVYTFPLSQDAAVDAMTMRVGDRVIEGEIREREEARRVYEQARAEGHVASLLDQERPNIFTQSVANIEPGEEVDITIGYSELLDWKDGEFQFDFPMVVGPRYIPGGPVGVGSGTGMALPTDQVPDADRVTPPVTPEGTRAGHDISVTVNLRAGLPIRRLDSPQHAVTVEYTDQAKTSAVVKLKDQETIPNRDFVLVFETAGEEVADAVLAHTDERGKFVTLVLQPPKRVRQEAIVPKELIFVIDSSGSMSGFPIETAKTAMKLCIENAHPNDTFNLLTFSGGTKLCFPGPVANTDENRSRALAFLGDLKGSGGTEMMKAIEAALADQHDPERVRVVCFMTDGYVGNDMAILDAVKKNAGTARVFAFGIGRSVNRFLLDGMAAAGRGEVQYILDESQAKGAGERFYERVRWPVLTDIVVDFGDLKVSEVYPPRVPDLFAARPVVVVAQYREGGQGTLTLTGRTGAGPFERKIPVTLPGERPENRELASTWARRKIDHLMQQDFAGIQQGNPNPALKEEILGLGLRYRLLTQFTSFVAVEKVTVTAGGQPRTVAVPVEMPQGVSYEGVFGDAGRVSGKHMAFRGATTMAGGMGWGMGGGGFGAVPAARPQSAAAPGTAPRQPIERRRMAELSDSQESADRERAPASKLAPELADLVAQLSKHAGEKTYTVGTVTVRDGRVEVQIQLADLSEATVKKLLDLGVVELGRARSVRLLIGTVAPEKLEALAALEVVQRIEPSTSTR